MHVEFVVLFIGHLFMVAVARYSKRPEVCEMSLPPLLSTWWDCLTNCFASYATFTHTCGLGTDLRPSRNATFTWGTRHAMGSVDTGPPGSLSKPGRTCDGHETTPIRLCVNGRVPSRNNGKRQRDLLHSKWHSIELFLTALVFPGVKKRR